MEGVGGIIGALLVIAAFVLGVLLLLLPAFVFQIANSSTRSEELLKKAIAELEKSTYELKKINAHLTPAPPEME
jgi:hypothetical protein